MNIIKRSILLPTTFRRYFLTNTKFRAIKNPCPKGHTSDDFQKLIVRPQFKKLKELQKKFQVDDGLPVWLKGGFKDKLLFQLTLVLMIIGFVMSGQTVYELVMRGWN